MSEGRSPRALKKQALLLRAAAERAELGHVFGELRQSASAFGKGAPALAMGKGLPLALGLLKRAPLLGPALSLMRAGARSPLLRYGALAAGAGWAGWKAWQALAAQRTKAATSAGQPDPDAPK